jgi:hypothetical protein
MNNDAPPQYFAPPGASKVNPSQGGAMEMPQYGAPMAQGPQQSGVVGSGPMGDVEQGSSAPQDLPPRPPQAKMALKSFVGRFRK